MSDSLAGLIKRLEAASEGSRELDGAIYCAISNLEFVRWDGAGIVYRGRNGIGHIDAHVVKPYTTSLDAALTLKPDGYAASVMERQDGSGWARIANTAIGFTELGATPALALCIAALKASDA